MLDCIIEKEGERPKIMMIPADKLSEYGIKPLKIKYHNADGKIEIKTVNPSSVWFGSPEDYPTPQFLLTVWDVDKQTYENLAVTQILEFIKGGK